MYHTRTTHRNKKGNGILKLVVFLILFSIIFRISLSKFIFPILAVIVFIKLLQWAGQSPEKDSRSSRGSGYYENRYYNRGYSFTEKKTQDKVHKLSFCFECGTQIHENLKYCNACGTKL